MTVTVFPAVSLLGLETTKWVGEITVTLMLLVTVTPEVTFDESLRLMEQHGVYHLLILGEGSKYLGMLSVSDLLKVMASNEKARADMLESYVFPNR